MHQILAELCPFESFCKLFTVYSLQIFNAARQLSHIEAAPDKSGLVLLDYWFGLKTFHSILFRSNSVQILFYYRYIFCKKLKLWPYGQVIYFFYIFFY